jgi:hypothetical protein
MPGRSCRDAQERHQPEEALMYYVHAMILAGDPDEEIVAQMVAGGWPPAEAQARLDRIRSH